MPTFRFLKSGDFAYELNMKLGVMNFHGIYNSPFLFFEFLFSRLPQRREASQQKDQRGFLKSRSVECV